MKYIYVLNGHSGCRYSQTPMPLGYFSSEQKAEKEKEYENYNESYPQFEEFTIHKVKVQ
jgi:hypothetical protein